MRVRGGSGGSSSEARSVIVARAFFHAATKLSDEDEDILPQEDGVDNKLSVYFLFSELFPEHVVAKVILATPCKDGRIKLLQLLGRADWSPRPAAVPGQIPRSSIQMHCLVAFSIPTTPRSKTAALPWERMKEHSCLSRPQDCSTSGWTRNGLTRLQFNKIGYEIYVKEQSRRVPAPRAKPGNPGYGFRRARWRSVRDGSEDRAVAQETLLSLGLSRARSDHILARVEEFRTAWDLSRRPSRPAGPGRPRGRLALANAGSSRHHVGDAGAASPGGGVLRARNDCTESDASSAALGAAGVGGLLAGRIPSIQLPQATSLGSGFQMQTPFQTGTADPAIQSSFGGAGGTEGSFDALGSLALANLGFGGPQNQLAPLAAPSAEQQLQQLHALMALQQHGGTSLGGAGGGGLRAWLDFWILAHAAQQAHSRAQGQLSPGQGVDSGSDKDNHALAQSPATASHSTPLGQHLMGALSLLTQRQASGGTDPGSVNGMLSLAQTVSGTGVTSSSTQPSPSPVPSLSSRVPPPRLAGQAHPGSGLEALAAAASRKELESEVGLKRRRSLSESTNASAGRSSVDGGTSDASEVASEEELLPTAIVGGARPVKKQTTPRGPSPMETSAIECKVEAGAVTEEGIPGTDETITGPHDATIVAASNKASIAHLMAVV
jgi:hypothetical protein